LGVRVRVRVGVGVRVRVKGVRGLFSPLDLPDGDGAVQGRGTVSFDESVRVRVRVRGWG
jgi:hypothetical protein